ncbi:MAG TPA: DNA-processing protein DprA [Acidimicrobiales bacterium]|jgi:predicted Rossmann fold nucleotide-binding protein DprA/Smf involved in DNA uptake|nr:DNA-processing protein DprA [Acidimicrobiales bacterium]
MPRSESSLVAVLLTQRLVDGSAEPLKATEYWRVLAQVEHLKELLGLSVDQLVREVGLDDDLAERVAARLDQATQVAFSVDDLEQSGIRVVASVDDDYPDVLMERLRTGAPPLLYVAGDPRLLSAGGLGVVGSRDVAPEGAEVAKAAAARAASAGVPVVSGGAKGVDRLAMGAALEAGGSAVGALADSLMRTVRDPDTRRAITDGSLCLCTPYKPSAGFSAATAMGRNKIIYALSTATLVVASDHDKGGTWSGAVEALKHGYSPVLVWTGEGGGKGNRPLVERGGIPIDDMDELFPLQAHVARSDPAAAPPPVDAVAAGTEQLKLEL